jgi:hypothetical protein
MKIRGLDVKWLANSKIYSEIGTGSEILKKSGLICKGSGIFYGLRIYFCMVKAMDWVFIPWTTGGLGQP